MPLPVVVAARVPRFLRLAALGLLAAFGALPGWAADAPPPVLLSENHAVSMATEMDAHGQRSEAIAMLEEHLRREPNDALARQMLVSLRIAALETSIRDNLTEQARTKELIVGDPDYEDARARATEEIRRRLDVVEYFIAQRQLRQAVLACNVILKDHPGDTATLQLKLRVLGALQKVVDDERDVLLRDGEVRHDEVVNEVIEHGTMPREKQRLARTILVFDEDVADFERQQVRDKLKERVDFVYKQAKIRDAIETLFKVAGINYVMLDTALGEETISTNLVQESVDNVLGVLARQVSVTFNYRGGTVWITPAPAGAGADVFEVEIIRLKAGLTDVQRTPKLATVGSGQQQQGGAQAGQGGGFVMGPNGQMMQQPQQQQQNQQNQQQPQAPSTESDLKRFIEEIPALIPSWPAGSEIWLERKSNTVYVKSTPAAIADVKRLLQAIDYDAVQVLIETRFVEVTESASRELGINWESQAQTDGGRVNGSGTIDSSGAFVSPPNGTARDTNGLIALITGAGIGHGVPDFRATIAALEQHGQADTLSEPKIIAVNNAVGVIEVTQGISYISGWQNISLPNPVFVNSTGGTPVPTTATTNQLVATTTTDYQGITLEIVPSVARNSDVISLTLSPAVKEMILPPITVTTPPNTNNSNTSFAPTVLPPTFDNRRLFTTLRVQNGQTVVLGGLERARNVKNDAGLPFLAHVPGLGILFGRQSKSNERRNLLIFVTAHIIDPGGAKLGDDIRKLRDTARVVLPDDIRAAEVPKTRYDAKDAKAKAAAPTAEDPNAARPAVQPAAKPSDPFGKGRGQ